MLRLDLVHQPDEMHVALVNHELVPSKAIHQMLELLRDNARDHLNAAVANTMGHDPRFLEQSIFASGLSEESAKTLHQLVRKRWLSLTQGLVPQIQKAIDEDRPSLQVVPSASQRIRIGMYFYNEAQHKDKK